MQRMAMALLGGLLGLGVAACPQPGEINGCNLGTLGCECVAGQCHGDLTCAYNICVDGSSSETGDGHGDGDGDDPTGGLCDPPPTLPRFPAQACLPDVPCATDAHCPDGHACNTELDPPSCQVLYCGTEGSICHADEACKSELQCHEGQCSRCDVCGDLCEVDFASDPNHCGCCNQPVPSGGVCNGGVAECAGGLPLCDGQCPNLMNDPNNCGACGNAVGPGQYCMNGKPKCNDGQLCEDTCVDLTQDKNNCGACGATCPIGTCSCDCFINYFEPYCEIQTTDASKSCAVLCGQFGMTCNSAVAQVATYNAACGQYNDSLGCSQAASAIGYCGPGCDCPHIKTVCACNPVPP